MDRSEKISDLSACGAGKMMQPWLKFCFTKSVMRRALSTVLIVGTILVTINYDDAILRGQITQSQMFRLALTFLVPYCASTYSSVSAMLEIKPKNG